MSKTFKYSKDDYRDYDDYEYGYDDTNKQKRKERRIRSAIKSKDIDALMEMDEYD